MSIDLRQMNSFKYLNLVGSLSCSRGIKAYLVGGAVRDLFARGESGVDLDFALSGDADDLPRQFAHQQNGTFFWLDIARKQSRVVVSCPSTYTFDFAPIRGYSIEEDLQQRDFTINALAIDVTTPETMLIDPLRGMHDIEARLLRQCSAQSFRQDPLRLIRLFRFHALLGYEMEDTTWKRLLEDSFLLSSVASERVRTEFFRILDVPGKRAVLERMVEAGVLQQVIGVRDSTFPWEGAIRQVSRMEKILLELKRELVDGGSTLDKYFEVEVEQGVKIRSLVMLASLLSVRNNATDDPGRRLKLGACARRMLSQMLSLADASATTGTQLNSRKMYRFFKDRAVGPEVVLVSFLSGSLSRVDALRLLTFYFSVYSSCNELITGDEIMKEFALQEGKEVGAAIGFIRAAESSGLVTTKEEALILLGTKLLTKTEC